MEITAHNAAVVADYFQRNPTRRAVQTAPALPTLADCDQRGDMDDLLSQVEKACLPHCNEIDFRDDNHKRGYRTLEFDVLTSCYNSYVDRDEDGAYRDYSKVREVVSVPVRPDMSLALIARLVASEVRGIENNCFAS